jgi:LytS/YehU family sensor histidine kinase
VDVPYPWWMHPITRVVEFLLVAAGFVWTGYTVQHRRTLQRVARLEREKELESVRRLATEAQLQTLRLQMNPHFLYNVLAEIQHLVETGNELASHYIAIFSRLLDRVLKKAVNNFISVSDEIHILKQYIALEELRNAGRLQCYVMLDAAHDDADGYDDSHESEEHDTAYWQAREMPTFILQPFVENAIRHGIRGLLDEDWAYPRQGIITVNLYEEGDMLRCVVEDNGVGREEAARRKAARPQKEHLSIATSVTQERLRLLTETFGIPLTVEYNDLYDESGVPAGTLATITMPLRKVSASNAEPDTDVLPRSAP